MSRFERPIIGIDERKRADLLVRSVREDDRFREVAVEHLLHAKGFLEARIVEVGTFK